MLERLLDPYFLGTLFAIMAVNGVIGFVFRLMTPNADILFFRRLIRGGLIFVLFCIFVVSYRSAPEFDPQSLLPEDGTDWLSVMTSSLAVYFGAWAFIVGLEKRQYNVFIFFNPEFYHKIEKPRKKR